MTRVRLHVTTGEPAVLSDILSEPMDPQQKMREVLAALWQQHHPAIMERLDVISRAAEALRAGRLDDRQREEAQSAAHKLAGALGTFGLEEGTNLARKIENLLNSSEGVQVRLTELDEAVVLLKKVVSS